MRYISLFSGIEAASVAWKDLGWEPVAFSEIAPFPCEVLKQRFPDVPNLGDITQINWNEVLETYGTVDLVVGGSPCQSFSIAGGRESLDGESRLMFEFIRAVREIRPRYLLWENVPGCLSAKGQEGEVGGAFKQLLTELCDIGYGVAWRVLDAQFFGVAQRRRRVFLVGCLGDPISAGEILFERESLRWDHPSSREKRKSLAGAVISGIDECGGCLNPWDVQSKRIYSPNDVCPTIPSGTTQGMNIQPSVCYSIAGNIIGRSENNGGNGGGFRDDGAVYTLTATDVHGVVYLPFNLTQITSPLNRSNPQFNEECHTLAATDRPPHVCIAFSAGQSSEVGSIGAQEEVAPTFRGGCSGTNQVPSICFTWNGGSGFSSNDDLSPTLRSARCGEPAVCIGSNEDDVCGALCAHDARGVDQQTTVQGKLVLCIADNNSRPAIDEDLSGTLKVGGSSPIVATDYIVRRLMPIECERLQGFPDGFTDIEVKGKSASDSARYAALGNSIAVPVLTWIGKRIDEMETTND